MIEVKHPHILLYAKGAYRKSDMIDDLRKILSYTIGLSEDEVSISFIEEYVVYTAIECLLYAAIEPLLCNKKTLAIYPILALATGNGKTRKALDILKLVKTEYEGRSILNTKPNPDILPLAEK